MSSESSQHFSLLIRAQITDGANDSAHRFKTNMGRKKKKKKKVFGTAFHRKIGFTGGAMTKYYIFTLFKVVM